MMSGRAVEGNGPRAPIPNVALRGSAESRASGAGHNDNSSPGTAEPQLGFAMELQNGLNTEYTEHTEMHARESRLSRE